MANESRTDQWNEDLHRENLPDEEVGQQLHQSEALGLNAAMLKDLRTRLPGLTDEELKQLPVEPQGYLLHEGGVYVNLRDPQLQPFTAHGGMRAGHGDAYLPKSSVDYLLWNRVTGVDNPRELDLPDDAPLHDPGPRG